MSNPGDSQPLETPQSNGEDRPVKIRVENLTKVFGHHPERALKLLARGENKNQIFEKTGQAVGLYDATFDVYQGETLVVMGLSGSGKSTLIRCLNRLIEPTHGKVEVDGQEVTKLDHEELLQLRRHKFGMVFQNFALFPHRTVLQNTVYGLEIQGVGQEEREEKAAAALKLVGLEGWGDSYPAQLSGGMQQRVGLARALTVDPDILLMDEAFSALDPLIRRDMQHELIALQDRVQKTIVFITHDLDEAVRIGDRIILMKDGKIIQVGTAEDILTKPANGYVEKFVEDVDLSKALSVRSIMTKARAVGYLKDGPRTALHKMKEEGISNLFVVKTDYTLQGIISAQRASQAVKEGVKHIAEVMDEAPAAIGPDEPLQELFGPLAETATPVPVVDEDGKLVGVVVRGTLLAGLAEGGLN